jgi:hypothetical protein
MTSYLYVGHTRLSSYQEVLVDRFRCTGNRRWTCNGTSCRPRTSSTKRRKEDSVGMFSQFLCVSRVCDAQWSVGGKSELLHAYPGTRNNYSPRPAGRDTRDLTLCQFWVGIKSGTESGGKVGSEAIPTLNYTLNVDPECKFAPQRLGALCLGTVRTILQIMNSGEWS